MKNKIVIICAIAIILVGVSASINTLNTGGSVNTSASNNKGVFVPRGAVVCNPGLNLPTTPVTVIATYTASPYFNIYLSDVPTDGDYDVADGNYPGWCAQAEIWMTRGVEIGVHLYSSYDPNIPDSFKYKYQSDSLVDWGLINYLINHRTGYTRMEVQNVIWELLGYNPYIPSGSDTEELLNDVLTNGPGFCPQPGDLVAILCDKITTDTTTFQRCFFEIVLPTTECTRSQGYWKNHEEAWPVDSITIGGVPYTKANAIDIMKHNSAQDMTYQMFQQLVATKLNLIRGTASGCLGDTVVDADEWMEAHPPGSGVTADSEAWDTGEPLKDTLDDYNNGLLCAPHCDD